MENESMTGADYYRSLDYPDNGRLTVSCQHDSTGLEYVNIELRDAVRHGRLTVRMSMEDYARVVTGEARIPCTYKIEGEFERE